MPQYKFWSGVYLLLSGSYFILAWVLIFKTDWVADKAKVPKEENPYTPLDRSVLLPVGIQVLGVYFLLIAIPDLVYGFFESNRECIKLNKGYTIWYSMYVNFSCLVQICLAALCIIRVDAIAKFIADKANVMWMKIVAFILLASGILVILIRILVSAMATDH